MFEIALLRPEIPPNTGNIIRLCANIGCHLHIIGPLGFSMEDKQMRRAGLDYHDLAKVTSYNSFEHFSSQVPGSSQQRLLISTSQGQTNHVDIRYTSNDILMFGPETLHFPDEVLHSVPPEQTLRIPMQNQSRCLNLSNAVAIVAYEAWRQHNFTGGQ